MNKLQLPSMKGQVKGNAASGTPPKDDFIVVPSNLKIFPPPALCLEEEDVKKDCEDNKSLSLENKVMKNSSRARMTRVVGCLPAFNSVPTHRKKFYFLRQTDTGSSLVTAAQLLMVPGGYCTTANSTIRSVASSVKLHSVGIFTAGGQDDVFWTASSTAEYQKDQDTILIVPSDSTVATYGTVRPPKGSLADFWQTAFSSTEVIFTLQLTAGAIVVLDLSWTSTVNLSQLSDTGYTAATLGSFYYGKLSNQSSARLVPIGLPFAV